MQKGFVIIPILIGVLVIGGAVGAWYTKLIQIPNFPPPGCYYQQIQCIQAPCNPILTCGTSSSNPVATPQTTPSLNFLKGSEEYCRQFGPGGCPSDCELSGPSCPVCMDIGTCHAKGISKTPSPTPSPVDVADEKMLNFETIPARNFTDYARNVTEPLVVNDIDGWEKIVNQPEIGIDFKKYTVIAVLMSVMTGGYNIQVKEVVDKGESIDVVILKTRPGKNCFVTQAVTFYSHVIKLQKISKAVNFIVQDEIRDCSR